METIHLCISSKKIKKHIRKRHTLAPPDSSRPIDFKKLGDDDGLLFPSCEIRYMEYTRCCICEWIASYWILFHHTSINDIRSRTLNVPHQLLELDSSHTALTRHSYPLSWDLTYQLLLRSQKASHLLVDHDVRSSHLETRAQQLDICNYQKSLVCFYGFQMKEALLLLF